jgi:hypothetical protein
MKLENIRDNQESNAFELYFQFPQIPIFSRKK